MTDYNRQVAGGRSDSAGEPPPVRVHVQPKIAGAVGWVAAGRIVGQVFWFSSLLVLAALLPPDAFGTVSIGLVLVAAATRLMEAGTSGAIVVERDLTAAQVRRSLVSNVVRGAAVSAAIVLLAGPIVDTFAAGGDPAAVRTLGIAVVIYAFSIVPMALLSKRLAFRPRSAIYAAAAIVASLFAVASGFAGAGVWALVIRQLLYYALLSALAWFAAGPLSAGLSTAPSPRGRLRRRLPTTAFFLFALTDFIVFNADYVVVGSLTDAHTLGLYTLAFTLAFTPVLELSHVIGTVLFTFAASSDTATVRRRTLKSLGLTSLALLPLVPAVVAVAPTLVPAVIGSEWRAMVVPLQILVVVAVAKAIVNVVGESLAGTGHMGFRAVINVPWMTAMIVALVVLVKLYGIRGAAVAHIVLYVPIVITYAVWGLRRLEIRIAEVLTAVGSVGLCVLAQAAATFGTIALLREAGATDGTAAVAGTIVGLAVFAAIATATQPAPVQDAKSLIAAVMRPRSSG